jgi:hypothetical protein
VVLGENDVSRWRAGEECECGKGLSQSRRNHRLDDRYNRRYMQQHSRFGDLHAHVRDGAERAVRMRDVALRMDVNCLNRTAGNDQRDAQ